MAKFLLFSLTLSLVACGRPEIHHTSAPSVTRAGTERPPVRSSLTIEPADGMPSIDRGHVPPPEDRWASPEARSRHEEVMNRLWGTTLGQMYLAYLTDDVEAPTVPGRARQIIDRIYEEGEHVGKRLQLVQSLTLDLYGRGKMSEDIVKRVVLFDRLAHTKETGNQEKNSDQLINLMIVAAVVSLPFGSPVVREEFAHLWRQSRRLCFWRQCNLHPVQWRRLLDLSAHFKDFRPASVAGTWLAVGGGASMLYSLGREKWPGWKKSVSRDDKMLNGLEDLLSEAEF